MIKPEDENIVRLISFGAALLAITMRGQALKTDDLGIPTKPIEMSEWVLAEARAISNAVIEEAKLLKAQYPTTISSSLTMEIPLGR